MHWLKQGRPTRRQAGTTEAYNINIYYEVDEDVEQSEIYKAFVELIKTL